MKIGIIILYTAELTCCIHSNSISSTITIAIIYVYLDALPTCAAVLVMSYVLWFRLPGIMFRNGPYAYLRVLYVYMEFFSIVDWWELIIDIMRLVCGFVWAELIVP